MFSRVFCLLCVSQALANVDLNIYRSVTEVRQGKSGIGSYQYEFENGEYGNIVDGMISWEGTPFIRQEIYNTYETLKGAIVNVPKTTVCECKTVKAKIIDPNSMLLQNVETGAFFYTDGRSIEYQEKRPNNGGTSLTLEFKSKKVKYNGTLSYLMRGITWTPNYDLLFTSDNVCSLVAYALIRNSQQQTYDVDNTFLYSGDLQLVNNYASSTIRAPAAARPAAKSVSADNANGKPIEFDGEEKGFYFYSLKTKYKLRPSSSVRLPFVKIITHCRFYYKAVTSISIGQYKGVFQRTYDITADKFVPAGTVTVRDNQVLVGQSAFPDLPENFTHSFSMGQDNDVRYMIMGNQSAANADKTKPVWRTYELDVTITNFKNKSVRGQLDFSGAIQTTIDNSNCIPVRADANLIHLPFELSAGEKNQCQLTVTLRYS